MPWHESSTSDLASSSPCLSSGLSVACHTAISIMIAVNHAAAVPPAGTLPLIQMNAALNTSLHTGERADSMCPDGRRPALRPES